MEFKLLLKTVKQKSFTVIPHIIMNLFWDYKLFFFYSGSSID